jgi:hypothetical protein
MLQNFTFELKDKNAIIIEDASGIVLGPKQQEIIFSPIH